MFLDVPSDEKLKIQTARLVLEPVTEAHAQELCDLFQDEELHRFVPFEVPSFAKQLERCTRWAKRKSPSNDEIWLNWAGRDSETGIVMGHFQTGIKQDNIASIGYIVARNFQRKGLASEALKAIFNLLQSEFNVREVKAWSDTRNIASHRLAKKLGMIQVEVLKDADFFKGQSSDEFVFSLVF